MNTTLIKNIHLLKNNGNTSLTNLLIKDDKIAGFDDNYNNIDNIIDGKGGYLIPGLIDAHTHTSINGRHDALKFGITTELEMMGQSNMRKTNSNQPMADVLSAGMGVTAEGGHPNELHKGQGIPKSVLNEMAKMSPEEKSKFIEAHEKSKNNKIKTASDAITFVDNQIKNGADYIKIMLDDGKYEDSYPLPILPMNVLKAAVDEAHKNNKLVIAHALEQKYALEAIKLGVDGLAHLFLERNKHTSKVLKAIVDHNVFVIPCLSLNASLSGIIPTSLSKDIRVTNKLSSEWIDNLKRSFNTAPQMNFNNSLKNVNELFKAGVKILAGTDVSQPAPNLGGLAHGASLHYELQLLVKAGLTPLQAIKTATKNTASIFSLDQGKIIEGNRADLLLLSDNPLSNITNTLNIKGVWHRGKLIINN